MQSSQDASKTTSSQDLDDMEPIATRSRKRTHSEMIVDDEEGNEPNYDILECFPILLCQWVFQHFSGKELIEMSTVNREWNKLVGERSQARKLKLVIDDSERDLTPEAKNVLMNSKRKYQHIEIRTYDTEFLLNFLAKGAGSWKSVRISTSEMQPQILRLIEPTVEEFSITEWSRSGNLSSENSSLTFPCLKFLDIFVSGNNIFKHFGRVTSLTTFRFSGWTILQGKSDIRTMLHNNHHLEELKVLDGSALLLDNSPKIKFKLRELSIKHFGVVNLASPLVSFLETQAQTLESLNITCMIDQVLLEVILRMPRLTTLATLSPFGEIQGLPVNTTITSLELLGYHGGGISYQSVIRAMPNLKHLRCDEIDDELLLFLAQQVPALESIDDSEFNVSRIPEGNIFPNIQKFTALWFHEDLQEPTGDNNFAKLVREEMRKSREAVNSDD